VAAVTDVYGTSALKRSRRTQVELDELDLAICTVCTEDHPLTVRGVFYRVMSAGAVEKSEKAYAAVQREVLKLRRSGILPYEWIADGTRWVVRPRSYDDLKDALTDTANLYRRNLWRSQDVEVHVFTEKDAITGVIEQVTDEWNVPLGVLRGYCSETFAYSMAQAIIAARKPVYVYQLGDHDPSGVGAWQDFQRKVSGFIPNADITFERLAVTPEQIIDLDLPTRPTKVTDTRARNFDGGSVEVDAIPAPILRNIVREAIEHHVDGYAVWQIEQVEESERSLLFKLAGIAGVDE
jgi:hypothetical protein